MRRLPLLAIALLLLCGCPTPTPEPPPDPPVPNPYPMPFGDTLDLVEPIAALTGIGSDDGKALAAMYAELATDAPDAEWSTAEFRAELIRRGKELGIQGKYPGLAEAVEAAFEGSELSKEEQMLDVPVAVEILEALAWAVWEASDG